MDALLLSHFPTERLTEGQLMMMLRFLEIQDAAVSVVGSLYRSGQVDLFVSTSPLTDGVVAGLPAAAIIRGKIKNSTGQSQESYGRPPCSSGYYVLFGHCFNKSVSGVPWSVSLRRRSFGKISVIRSPVPPGSVVWPTSVSTNGDSKRNYQVAVNVSGFVSAVIVATLRNKKVAEELSL